MQQHLFLVGPPGAGKSAVGRLLAERAGRPFLDTDSEVSARAGCSIDAIFARDGEPGFRRLEREVLQQLVERLARESSPAVVATGGGIVLDRRNTECMRRHGRIVYLQAEPEALEQRLARSESAGRGRPLLRNGERREKLRQLLQEREKLYREAADWSVSTDALDTAETATQIFSRLQAAETRQ